MLFFFFIRYLKSGAAAAASGAGKAREKLARHGLLFFISRKRFARYPFSPFPSFLLHLTPIQVAMSAEAASVLSTSLGDNASLVSEEVKTMGEARRRRSCIHSKTARQSRSRLFSLLAEPLQALETPCLSSFPCFCSVEQTQYLLQNKNQGMRSTGTRSTRLASSSDSISFHRKRWRSLTFSSLSFQQNKGFPARREASRARPGARLLILARAR